MRLRVALHERDVVDSCRNLSLACNVEHRLRKIESECITVDADRPRRRERRGTASASDVKNTLAPGEAGRVEEHFGKGREDSVAAVSFLGPSQAAVAVPRIKAVRV